MAPSTASPMRMPLATVRRGGRDDPTDGGVLLRHDDPGDDIGDRADAGERAGSQRQADEGGVEAGHPGQPGGDAAEAPALLRPQQLEARRRLGRGRGRGRGGGLRRGAGGSGHALIIRVGGARRYRG